MGQYYYPVNVTKRQFIHPHKFSDGLKLMEFGAGGEGTMLALAVLLADGNGRGGGDILGVDDLPVVGSWAGDQIVLSGDYSDPGKFVPPEFAGPDHVDAADRKNDSCKNGYNLHQVAERHFEDISGAVWEVLLRDPWTKEDVGERLASGHMFLLAHFLGKPKKDDMYHNDPKMRAVFVAAFGAKVVNAAARAAA